MLRRILPFFVGCLATVIMVDAQVATNVQVLKNAAQGISLKEEVNTLKLCRLPSKETGH